MAGPYSYITQMLSKWLLETHAHVHADTDMCILPLSPSPTWYFIRIIPSIKALPSQESHHLRTIGWNIPLTFRVIIQRKQEISFIILHWIIFHISTLIPQISLLNPRGDLTVCDKAFPGQHWQESTPQFQFLCAILFLLFQIVLLSMRNDCFVPQ